MGGGDTGETWEQHYHVTDWEGTGWEEGGGELEPHPQETICVSHLNEYFTQKLYLSCDDTFSEQL